MNKFHWQDVEAEEVEQGAKGVKIRWLITEDMGAEHFVLRHFEISPGGHTPLHAHPWEHEIFVLGGDGVVHNGGEDHPCRPGEVIFMPANEEHQFRCMGQDPFTMLCLIPARDKCSL